MSMRSDPADLSDWSPASSPPRAPIVGQRVRLEPVDPARHAAALYAAAHGPGHDPALWDYLGYGPFPSEAAFIDWLAAWAESDDPLF